MNEEQIERLLATLSAIEEALENIGGALHDQNELITEMTSKTGSETRALRIRDIGD